MKKINDLLAGLPMTIVGGVFLILSFVLRKTGVSPAADPAWATVIICGIPLLYLSVWRIIHNKGISKISSALLITIAMIAAVCIGDLFAAGEVAFIMEIGAILEDMTTERAKKGLKKLISLTPVQGRLIADGRERMIPAEEIKKGDILRVLAGETIPVDGVIIKSGEALEIMGKADIIAFDKTGTLTCGSLEVSDILPVGNTDSEMLLRLAASAESKSEHPLGKAVTACAKAKGIELFPCDSFKMYAGKGIFAQTGGHSLCCGSERFLAENGVTLTDEVKKITDRFASEGKASVIVAELGAVIGIITLSDVLRPGAKDMVSRLKDLGIRPVLLTGDNKNTAEHFAAKAGITEVMAELLPGDKAAKITQLQQNGIVCMIGDGVNDAPALKTAGVGVAMGGMGSDIAVESADIALTTDDISGIPYLKKLAKATRNTIKTAITISMCINFAAVTLSVLGVLDPTTGALVHNAGSCFVVLIAALLYDRKFD